MHLDPGRMALLALFGLVMLLLWIGDGISAFRRARALAEPALAGVSVLRGLALGAMIAPAMALLFGCLSRDWGFGWMMAVMFGVSRIASGIGEELAAARSRRLRAPRSHDETQPV